MKKGDIAIVFTLIFFIMMLGSLVGFVYFIMAEDAVTTIEHQYKNRADSYYELTLIEISFNEHTAKFENAWFMRHISFHLLINHTENGYLVYIKDVDFTEFLFNYSITLGNETLLYYDADSSNITQYTISLDTNVTEISLYFYVLFECKATRHIDVRTYYVATTQYYKYLQLSYEEHERIKDVLDNIVANEILCSRLAIFSFFAMLASAYFVEGDK